MEQLTINVHDVIDRERIGGLQKIIIVLCGLVMFVDGFNSQTISYIVPALARDWHLPRAALGPIFSAGQAGSLIGYLVGAPLSNRFGHKRFILGGMIVVCLSLIVSVFATSLQQLVVLRFLSGLTLGAIVPSTIAIACEFSPKRLRATAVLLIYCCFSLGFASAGLAAGTLLPRLGWQSLFWVGALVPVVLVMLLGTVLPESLSFLVNQQRDQQKVARAISRLYPRLVLAQGFSQAVRFVSEQEKSERAGVVGLVSGRVAGGTVLLWATFITNVAAFYFLQNWLPTMLTNLHYAQTSVVWVTALTTLGGALSAFVIGPLMDRIGPYSILSVLYLCGGFLMVGVGFALSSSVTVLMVATFCAGFCVSGGQKSVIALAALYYPPNLRSTGVGWALAAGRIGGVIGPLLVGFLYAAKWEVDQIFYVAAVPVFFASLAIFVMGRIYSGERRQGAPAVQGH